MKLYQKLFILVAVMLSSFIISISLGSVNIPFRETIRVIFSSFVRSHMMDISQTYYNIIVDIRVPRVFLGMLAGASLAVSGLVFQAILKNPLADPYTLGISAGAAFGAGFAIFLSHVLHPGIKALMPVFAFSGAISTIFLVYFLARTKGRVQMLTIILSGVIVSYLFSSGLVLVMSLLGDRSHEVIYWLMGSLAGYHRYLSIAAGVLLVLMVLIFAFYRDLDLISLGDEHAMSLGVNTDLVRLLLFSVTSVITAIVVSMTGTIGFVGLIIPHAMRFLFGPRHRLLIPVSLVAGASFLPLSDTLGRTLPAILFSSGIEVPVGVITSLFGSPFFIFLLMRGKRKLWF